MTRIPTLRVTGLVLRTPSDRVLIENLNLQLASGDRVAIIGRNGVGKSSLLEVLAGQELAEQGTIERSGTTALVRQKLKSTKEKLSRGEVRRRLLARALREDSELLLLDEPTQDLDAEGIDWLIESLRSWQGTIICVSHCERLLAEFQNFFLVAESGCRYLSGTYSKVKATLEQKDVDQQKQYLRTLNALTRMEGHNALVRRRRLRKKNGGRVRELDRAPSRAKLNAKRSYAQESQGKRTKIQRDRIETRRGLAKATRRALDVKLSLGAIAPILADADLVENIVLESVGITRNSRVLVDSLNLRVCRERLAVTGANRSGKTSLLAVMLGTMRPNVGHATRRSSRIGSIVQGATNWMLEDSLLTQLLMSTRAPTMEYIASLLSSHGFPLALAERPLHTLSPGERFRAALIMLFDTPSIELLILDEPTYSLDIVGLRALRIVLSDWQGGLIVATHDREFLDAIRIEREIALPTTVSG